jgi:hypothetical protein
MYSEEIKELHFPCQIIVGAIKLNGNSGGRWWKDRCKGEGIIGVGYLDDAETGEMIIWKSVSL